MTEPLPAAPSLSRLLDIMRRLRDPERGCPWDLAQDFRSLAPFTLEEACEVVDALERGDLAALPDELGDLLFQVVFLSQVASERGLFDFDAVAAAIAGKLLRRHPHVFGDAPSDGDLAGAWDRQKSAERAAKGQRGVLADIPRSLPALARAAKIGRRAGRVGFDWDRADGPRAKLLEELAEVDAAAASGDAAALEEEVGDLLLAATSWARHLGVDPETALRRANAKFERRFAAMEQLAAARGLALDALDAAAWDALWNESKQAGPFSHDSSVPA